MRHETVMILRFTPSCLLPWGGVAATSWKRRLRMREYLVEKRGLMQYLQVINMATTAITVSISIPKSWATVPSRTSISTRMILWQSNI